MKIITTTSRVIRAYGEEKGIEMLAKAGFDGVDVSMFFKPGDDSILTKSDDEVRAYYTNLREIIEKNGLYVYQTHTPFPVISDNLEENDERWEMQRKALMASGIVGARQAIVHPTKFYPAADGTLQTRLYNRNKEENLAFNLDMYGRLLPYLEEYNIKAAIENMFAADPAKKNVYCPTICSNAAELAKLCDDCNAMCKNGDKFVICMDIG
ncbi:MAG: TIM barrel protein, partial [Clostridia bacterium]|nr:TIM barrel protein [Clostridia bacterium]